MKAALVASAGAALYAFCTLTGVTEAQVATAPASRPTTAMTVAAATQDSSLRNAEFMPEAFAAVVVAAETQPAQMTEPATWPRMPDKSTSICIIMSYRFVRYVTLKDIWVGYSMNGVTLIDAHTGQRPQTNGGEKGYIQAVLAATPANKALMEKGRAIRARYPNGGLKMWEELADLVSPGMTIQEVQVIMAPVWFNMCCGSGSSWAYWGRVDGDVEIGVGNAWTAVDRRLGQASWPIREKPIVRVVQDTPASKPTSRPDTQSATFHP